HKATKEQIIEFLIYHEVLDSYINYLKVKDFIHSLSPLESIKARVQENISNSMTVEEIHDCFSDLIEPNKETDGLPFLRIDHFVEFIIRICNNDYDGRFSLNIVDKQRSG